MTSAVSRRALVTLVAAATFWTSFAAVAADTDAKQEQVQQAHASAGEPRVGSSVAGTRDDAPIVRKIEPDDAATMPLADPDPASFDWLGVETWWHDYQQRRKPDQPI